MSYKALQRLYEQVDIPVPSSLKLLPDFWHIRQAGQMGGQRRFRLYGPLGSFESRRKGGLATIEKFRKNPQLARKLGFLLPKKICIPRKSKLLAEFIGIVLGDGCMGSRYQVTVWFNSETDRVYGEYIKRLFLELFGVGAAIHYRSGEHTGVVTASSRALIECLESLGLQRGDKIMRGADVPSWIWKNRNYQGACLRGLMDTDGSVYSYHHRVNGRDYHHLAICFTNYSRPLLYSVEGLLRQLNFHPVRGGRNIYLHHIREVHEYFQKIGSRNPKHLQKYQAYSRQKGATCIASPSRRGG